MKTTIEPDITWTQKRVSDLQVGDRVNHVDGGSVVLIRISNGMYRNSKLLEWRGGWGCMLNTDTALVAPSEA